MDSFVLDIAPIFGWLVKTSIQASVIVLIVIGVKYLLSKKLAPRWHYYLWLLVIARLLMPVAPQSTFSIFNLFSGATEQTTSTEMEPGNTEVSQATTPEVFDPGTKYTPQPPIETAAIEYTPTEYPAATANVDLTATPEIIETASVPAEVQSEQFDYIALLPLIWLIGAAGLALYVLLGNIRLSRIVTQQRPVTDSKVLDLLEDCKSQMKLHTYLSVVETEKIASPALFGFIRPRLLLPKGLLEKLTPVQLRHVFLHELAHLKRGDIYLGWLVALLQTVHWFNPMVWYAFHKMRADRELACDQLALGVIENEEPNEYGKTIVSLLENFSAPSYNPGLAGILEDRSQLKRRITMIAKHKKGSYRFSILAAIVLITLCAVALTSAKDKTPIEEKKAMASEFVDLLLNKQFKEAAGNFDKTMKRALPARKLKKAWNETTANAGQFDKKLGTRAEKYLFSDIIYVTCQFEEGPLDVKVVYDKSKKISGLWFVPVPEKVLKEYARNVSSNSESEIRLVIKQFWGAIDNQDIQGAQKAHPSFPAKKIKSLKEERDEILRGKGVDLDEVKKVIIRNDPADALTISIPIGEKFLWHYLTIKDGQWQILEMDDFLSEKGIQVVLDYCRTQHKMPKDQVTTVSDNAETNKKRYFVTIVAGSDDERIGYDGEQLGWTELEEKLGNLADKKNTVLEVAFKTGIFPGFKSDNWNEWLNNNKAFEKAGVLVKKLGLEGLSFVGPDNPSSRRGPVSVRTEGKLELNKDIAVGLGSFEQKPLLNIDTVKFSKSDDNLTAMLKFSVTSYPHTFWEIGVRLLDDKGHQIDSVVKNYDNKGIALGYPLHSKDQMAFEFGQVDIETVDRFEVKLREVLKTNADTTNSPGWKELTLPDMDSGKKPAMLALDTYELVPLLLDRDEESDEHWLKKMMQTPSRCYLLYEEASNKENLMMVKGLNWLGVRTQESKRYEPIFKTISKTLPDTFKMTSHDGQTYEFTVLETSRKSCKLKYRLVTEEEKKSSFYFDTSNIDASTIDQLVGTWQGRAIDKPEDGTSNNSFKLDVYNCSKGLWASVSGDFVRNGFCHPENLKIEKDTLSFEVDHRSFVDNDLGEEYLKMIITLKLIGGKLRGEGIPINANGDRCDLVLTKATALETDTETKLPEPVTPKTFPYIARPVSEDVKIRSGRGDAYYVCGKLKAGVDVSVVEEFEGWAKIVPPKGSFSWIAKKYVKIDPSNPKVVFVNSDEVRVWVGSPALAALSSSVVQAKLSRKNSDVVELLGEEDNGYLKIAPPLGAFLYVPVKQLKYIGTVRGKTKNPYTFNSDRIDGFENGKLDWWDITKCSPSIKTSEVHSGDYSVELNATLDGPIKGGKRDEDVLIKLFPDVAETATVEAWVNPLQWGNAFSDIHFSFLTNTGQIHADQRFHMWGPNHGYYYINGQRSIFTHSLPLNVWTKVKITYSTTDNGTIKYYENDKLQLTIPNSGAGIKGFFLKAGIYSQPVRFLVDDVSYKMSPFSWGKPSQGLQCRLRADKYVWESGQTPVFKFDLKNNSQKNIEYIPLDAEHCQIEVDGQWYGWAEPIMYDGPAYILKTGDETKEAITIKLTDSWALPKDGKVKLMPGIKEFWTSRLKLKPGKHTVRASFNEGIPGSGKPPKTAISNPVVIEILPKKVAASKKQHTPLSGQWSFNGNAKNSLTGKNATVKGATLTDGVKGQAYYFDGVDDIIVIENPDKNYFVTPTVNSKTSSIVDIDKGITTIPQDGKLVYPVNRTRSSFTAAAWVNVGAKSIGKDAYIFGHWKHNKDRMGSFTLQMLPDSRLEFAVSYDGSSGGGTAGTGAWVDSKTKLTAGTWTHVATVFDDENDLVSVYVNGKLDATRGASGNPYNSMSDYTIGGSAIYEDRYFNGKIDEVHIINKALTEDEINKLIGKTTSTKITVQDILGVWEMLEVKGERSKEVKSAQITFKPDGTAISEGTDSNDKYQIGKATYAFKNNQLVISHEGTDVYADIEDERIILIAAGSKFIYKKKTPQKNKPIKIPALLVLDSVTNKPIEGCSFTFSGWGHVGQTDENGIYNDNHHNFAGELTSGSRGLQLWHPDYDNKYIKDYKPGKDGISKVYISRGGNCRVDIKVTLEVRGKMSDYPCRVRILKANRKEIRRTERSKDNQFNFSGLKAGKYLVEAYFWDSYPTVYKEIELSENEHKKMEINAVTDQAARIRVIGKLLDKHSGKGIAGAKVHFVGAPSDDAITNDDGSFSTMADRARFHQCLIMIEKRPLITVRINNHIDETLAKKLEIHIDPMNLNSRTGMTDEDGDGVFCDKLHCTICKDNTKTTLQDYLGKWQLIDIKGVTGPKAMTVTFMADGNVIAEMIDSNYKTKIEKNTYTFTNNKIEIDNECTGTLGAGNLIVIGGDTKYTFKRITKELEEARQKLKSSIIGVWKMVEVTGEKSSEIKDGRLIFKDDGTAISEGTDSKGKYNKNHGKYIFLHDKFVFIASNGYAIEIELMDDKLSFSVDNTKMTFKKKTSVKGSDTSLDVVKQHDSLLNDGQKAYRDWTWETFAGFLDQSVYIDKVGEERSKLETQWIDQLNKGRSGEYYSAINRLAAIKSTKAVAPLIKIAAEKREKDNRGRWMATRALGIIGDKTAAAELIHLVYHYNQNTRFWAQISLVRLTGKNFGTDYKAWVKWWNDNNDSPKVQTEKIEWTKRYPEYADPEKQKEQDSRFYSKTNTANTESIDKRAKALVENFFRNNYRDITSRKTIEWGKATIDKEGNLSIRYKYEAVIRGKKTIVENKVWTFDKDGRFVSVEKAGETEPGKNIYTPDKKAEMLPGKLVFHGRYTHRSRNSDYSLPGEIWIKEGKDGSINAVSDLSWMGTYDLAASDSAGQFIAYSTQRYAAGSGSPYSINLKLENSKAILTRSGIRQDVTDKAIEVPAGTRFSPNTRPDSYTAANILFRSLKLDAGKSKEMTVYDWDNTGEKLADYKIQITNKGKESVTVPAGTFSANHYELKQLTSANTWFKKRAGHITDFWVLDNNVIVRILRHREPYELLLLDYKYPKSLGKIDTAGEWEKFFKKLETAKSKDEINKFLVNTKVPGPKQSFVAVKGRIVDSSGKPVAGASVIGKTTPLENGGIGETREHTEWVKGQEIRGVSDKDGYYELKGFKAAHYINVFRMLINRSKDARGPWKFFVELTAGKDDLVQTAQVKVPLAGEDQLYRARRLLKAYSSIPELTEEEKKQVTENIDQPYPFAKCKGSTLTDVNIILKPSHIPSTSYINEQGHIIDKTDYPFVNDPAVIATWVSVDFVENMSQFNPAKKSWGGKLFLNDMTFCIDGNVECTLDKEQNSITCTDKWTKGLVMDKDTASKYTIKEIDGSDYMFFEWKSGDYRIRHMKPSYYVLKKTKGADPVHSQLKTDRGVIKILQTPSPENDFALIVRFDDDANAEADWYDTNLTITTSETQPQKTFNIQIKAYIDGISDLVLKGNTVFWHNHEWAVPGRHGNNNYATTINGLQWLPEWPQDISVPRGEMKSDVFKNLPFTLPRKKVNVQFEIKNKSVKNSIYLPDVDDKRFMLDLASGELVKLPDIQDSEKLLATIDKLDKGDIIFDFRNCVFLRGASCGETTAHPAGLGLSIYKVPADKDLPKKIIATNRQGQNYILNILSVDKGGINIQLSQTDEKTAKAISADKAKIQPGEVSFEKYFPASQSGAEALDRLWNDPKKDTKNADEILDTARNGLRLYRGRGNILRWVGNLFIWGKTPQNPKAIELMYHASGSDDRNIYGDAIYFGLSVTKEKTPEILNAMAAVAMKTDDYYNVTGRILWGCKNQMDELTACLDPYLKSEDEAIRKKAKSVKAYFADSKAFMAARAKEHIEAVKNDQSGNLEGYKKYLLGGDSQKRMQTLKHIQSKNVMTIADESFLEAFEACLKDGDPQVRNQAARVVGQKFVWGANPQNSRAIEMLIPLLQDSDRNVRYTAVYFGLSTVNKPSKELLEKTLSTILDDREVNYFGRVIWGGKRNNKAVKEILTGWINQTEDQQKAIKAYEIYEDVTQQPLDEKNANRFAGKKSNVHEGLAALVISRKPIDKNTIIKQFTECLEDKKLLTKVSNFYILENQQMAVGMFTCETLSDRNAIRKALLDGHGFIVTGYMHGKIGPTGSGWLNSMENFEKHNKPYLVNFEAE